MTGCDVCEMIERKSSFKVVYEDENAIAMLHESPAFLGHTVIVPKKHFRILEEVPDKVVSEMFNLANMISTALFNSLNIHGTNILVNNGPDAGQLHPHFMINVIPRSENDGINMEWPPEKTDYQKLEGTFKFLKTYVEKAISGDTGEPKAVETEEKVIKGSKDDYMIKQFHRMP